MKDKLTITYNSKFILSMFILVFILPAIFSVVRKLTPGQSSAFEVISVIPISIATITLIMINEKRYKRLPSQIGVPLFFWAMVQFLYATFSIATDVRIGIISIITRIVPLVLSFVAFNAFTS